MIYLEGYSCLIASKNGDNFIISVQSHTIMIFSRVQMTKHEQWQEIHSVFKTRVVTCHKNPVIEIYQWPHKRTNVHKKGAFVRCPKTFTVQLSIHHGT